MPKKFKIYRRNPGELTSLWKVKAKRALEKIGFHSSKESSLAGSVFYAKFEDVVILLQDQLNTSKLDIGGKNYSINITALENLIRKRDELNKGIEVIEALIKIK